MHASLLQEEDTRLKAIDKFIMRKYQPMFWTSVSPRMFLFHYFNHYNHFYLCQHQLINFLYETRFVQMYTLYASIRPFGCSVLMAGYDKRGPQLYMIEPSGVSWVIFSSIIINIYFYLIIDFNRVIMGLLLEKEDKLQRQKLRNWSWTSSLAKKLYMKLPECILFQPSFFRLAFLNYNIIIVIICYHHRCCCYHYWWEKRLHTVHDEVKDKYWELELSWVSDDTKHVHQLVPKEIKEEAERRAKEALEQADK